MIICICNNFNDTAVREYFDSIPQQKTSVEKTYSACSGGKEPNCGICARNTLKDLVDEHNDGITPCSAPPAP